ncbi:hypothetical protein BKA56DRAFT_736817 [Ilyonectria sp. MPI-CAGE-AT-0026]|nr:hypothetical protein BKA56DRAFT_736817 [Ilyonectria sp. MPI-CAGE-AT-0026]
MLDQVINCAEPCHELKQQIAAALWDTPGSEISSLNFFFTYYAKQCELIALHEGGTHVSLKTHQDIMRIVQLFKDNRPHDEILLLTGTPGADRRRDYSIDLAARLYLMMEFGNLPYVYSGCKQLEWSQGSLRDFIVKRFEKKRELGHDNIKLEKIFNARNLRKIGGVEVAWTANLADHLRLMKDDKIVAIFHHASFLRRQQRDASLYPKELITETLNTIALLFPKWDQGTRAWYLQESSLRGLDTYAIEVGHLDTDQRQIENFTYWHDRLVILKQVFDEARPNTLQHWWNDRRNGVQWYTFWVAILILILTVFFGLVQSIEGALQVYKAFNPT